MDLTSMLWLRLGAVLGVVEVVAAEIKIRKSVALVQPMVSGGLITLEDVEVISPAAPPR